MNTSDATLIIGPGRVGSTLARALHAAGWPVTAIAARRAEAAASLARTLGADVAGDTLDMLDGPRPVVLLAVSDGAVRTQAERLVDRGLVDARSVVLHVSGVHGSDVLEAVSATGAAAGSMHPLQTFPDAATGERHLPGSYWFIEGAPRARATAMRMVACLRGTAHVIATGNKALYHASASMACNLFTALLDAALAAAAAAGLEPRDMMRALHPLVRTALDNAVDHGPRASLTGPVSRGDVETVRMHVAAIAGIDGLPAIYRHLAGRSIDMALETGRIDASTAAALREALAG